MSCKTVNITDNKTNNVETVYFSGGFKFGCHDILIKKLTIQYKMLPNPKAI